MVERNGKARNAHNFGSRKPTDENLRTGTKLREAGKTLADLIVDLVPDSEERRHAITHVEQAIMFAHAAVSRHANHNETT